MAFVRVHVCSTYFVHIRELVWSIQRHRCCYYLHSAGHRTHLYLPAHKTEKPPNKTYCKWKIFCIDGFDALSCHDRPVCKNLNETKYSENENSSMQMLCTVRTSNGGCCCWCWWWWLWWIVDGLMGGRTSLYIISFAFMKLNAGIFGCKCCF